MDESLKQIDRLDISLDSLRTLITDAVQAGRQAEKTKARKPFLDETERRLYAYPDLKIKLARDRADIKDLRKEIKDLEARGRSKDVIIANTGGSGQRLSVAEKKMALIQARRASADATKKEIQQISEIIEILSWRDNKKQVKEVWIETLTLKYFDDKNDEEIAELLHCDKSTVWRNRSRLLSRLMTLWYGADAIRKTL